VMFSVITISNIKIFTDHLSVELDNGEKLALPHQAGEMYRLVTGKIIDFTEYAQLKEESQRYQCKIKALNYLAVRMRSASEMERYLYKKGFAHDAVREVLHGLNESGYIDDSEYALHFINSKLNKKLVGKHLLASELQKKGISRAVIKQALKESEHRYSNIDEIYETALKKYDMLKNKKNGILKLAFFLQRRGFESEIVNIIISRISRKAL
jgi:regulatory protein